MTSNQYPGKTVNTVYHQEFIVDNRFTVVKELGHGAYGIVCLAKYNAGDSTSSVAIKKITNIFSKTILCKRSLRELKLLQFFRGHKNITCLYDLDIVPHPVTGDFNEVYLYEELMECDMHQIIRSGQPLTDQHYQLFVYQILCGLKYIHLADVLHRDLKPGNLLVNADCELKICDFGLARGFSENSEQNQGYLTEYVATRWYRAPEIMLSFTNYTKAIDMWSVGCILAEMLGGKPLFRGRDYVDQLNQILLILGTPPEETLTKIGSTRAQNYVRSLPFMPRVKFAELFPDANPLAIDLLEKMLTLDPYERITVQDALNHPYLSIWHEPLDELECAMKFDFKSFEEVNDIAEMKKLIVEEVRSFREFVRKPLEEQQQIQLQQQLRQQASHQEEQQQRQQLQQQQNSQNQLQHQDDNSPQVPPRQHQYEQFLLQLPLQQVASPGNEFVNTTSLAQGGTNQFYQQMPRPQELADFNFVNNPADNTAGLSNSASEDLFRLEEELGFGLDGLYHNNI